MADLKAGLRKLADVGSHLKEELEERAHHLKTGTQERFYEKRLERLIGSLGSGSDGERASAAAELLGLTRENPECLDQVVKAFLTSLAHQPAGAQWALIEALQQLRRDHGELEARIHQALRPCLKSPHKVVRLRLFAAWAREVRQTRYRQSHLADLLAGLQDPQKEVRFAVADLLIELSRSLPKTLAEVAGQALADRDWKVAYHGARLAAAIAKRRPELVEPLVGRLEGALHREEETHEVVLEVLGLVGAHNPGAVAPLMELLQRKLTVKAPNIRRSAAAAIGRIGGNRPALAKPAVARLLRMLETDDWMVHPPVLRAIGRIGYHRPNWFNPGLSTIEHMAQAGVDPEVKKAARWALARFSGSPPPPLFKTRPSSKPGSKTATRQGRPRRAGR